MVLACTALELWLWKTRGTAGGKKKKKKKKKMKNLLGWIRHLSAEETQGLETLADGVDVGHAHKHHLTVGIVLWSRRKTVVKKK